MATFTNQATLTYSGQTATSNIVTGELQEQLSVTKTAVSTDYAPGSVITYVVSVVNGGTADYTGITVTDDLGAYDFQGETLTPLTYIGDSLLFYSDGSLQPDPDVTAGPPLVFTGLTVPADGNIQLIYAARVNEYAPLGEGGEVTNTVTVTGTGVCTPVSDPETITFAGEPLVTIGKSLSPNPVADNGVLTYTFNLQNTGEALEAEEEAVLTDPFDPVLTDLTVTFNGQTWTQGTEYTYDEATGQFATVAGAVTVPAAVFTQDPDTGVWTTTPGTSVLTIAGTITACQEEEETE